MTRFSLAQAGAGGRYSFLTRKERDNESGLDYFGARYYASTQGRFTSVDPLMASASTIEPQSLNRYSYVRNRPLVSIDPDGMDDCEIGKTCSFTTNDWATSGNHPEEGQIRATVTVTRSDQVPLDAPTVELGTTINMRSTVPDVPLGPRNWDPSCQACSAFVPALASAVAPIPAAVVTFAGLSVAGGIAIGAAPAVVEAAFATGEGQAVFWSGYPEAQAAAAEFAETTGGSTIEMTAGGRALNVLDPVIRRLSPNAIDWLWTKASPIFATGASGTANVFLRQGFNPEGAWSTIEEPILIQNGVHYITHTVVGP